MTRDEIIEANPIAVFLSHRDVMLRGSREKMVTNRCARTEHKPAHLCVSIDCERNLWNCHDCEVGGTIIDWLMMERGIGVKEALESLGGTPEPPRPAPKANGSARVVKTYDYTDEKGALLFQVCRFEPKDFRQRKPDGKGGWSWSLEGVRRVLYRLPEVLKADCVWLTEGEKDADTLVASGLCATTNCGGAKKWDASYTAALRGKYVVLLPDNDKAGAEHRDAIRKEIGAAVKSLRIVEMPEGVKDVSDFFATFPTPKDASFALVDLASAADVLYRGQLVPVQTMAELEGEYRAHVARAATHQLDLGAWLPAFRSCVRPLVPGEVVAILAGTGCGKTMILQNIALHAPRLHTLMFEAELPGTLSFERFVAIATNNTGAHVESTYRLGSRVDWRTAQRLDHITCVHQSALTPERIAQIIESAELKTCVRPALVLIDYMQLIGATGSDRYERTSFVAERLKVVAKDTGTVIVVASQIHRKKGDDAREVSLMDGKDSGSIENSAGLVLGAWRDGEQANRLWVRVLKNTKGISGRTIPCRILDSLQIHEEATEP